MLVTGGLNDPRVSYWEPAKWVINSRALKTVKHQLLLKTNMGAGAAVVPRIRFDRLENRDGIRLHVGCAGGLTT